VLAERLPDQPSQFARRRAGVAEIHIHPAPFEHRLVNGLNGAEPHQGHRLFVAEHKRDQFLFPKVSSSTQPEEEQVDEALTMHRLKAILRTQFEYFLAVHFDHDFIAAGNGPDIGRRGILRGPVHHAEGVDRPKR
jgi:hypothetical protein